MIPAFRRHVDGLDSKVDALLAAKPFSYSALPRAMPVTGIYLFSKGGDHLYVGRSRRIRKRLANHCRPSATHYQATFAFRLARETTGQVSASYKPEGSRKDLCNDPAFSRAFDSAKEILRSLEIRFIEEADPVTQALLEIYAAIRLDTRYNDFDTH